MTCKFMNRMGQCTHPKVNGARTNGCPFTNDADREFFCNFHVKQVAKWAVYAVLVDPTLYKQCEADSLHYGMLAAVPASPLYIKVSNDFGTEEEAKKWIGHEHINMVVRFTDE